MKPMRLILKLYGEKSLIVFLLFCLYNAITFTCKEILAKQNKKHVFVLKVRKISFIFVFYFCFDHSD